MSSPQLTVSGTVCLKSEGTPGEVQPSVFFPLLLSQYGHSHLRAFYTICLITVLSKQANKENR